MANDPTCSCLFPDVETHCLKQNGPALHLDFYYSLSFFFTSVCAYTDVITCVPWHVCGGQRKICMSQLSPSTMCVKEMKLGLSGLGVMSLHTEPACVYCLLFLIFSFFPHINYKFYMTWSLAILKSI